VITPCFCEYRKILRDEGSSSFLKKRTKKLCSFGLSLSGQAEAETDKSFLLLFFKKEDLSFALEFGFPRKYGEHQGRGG
jgi:hypothetical protein